MVRQRDGLRYHTVRLEMDDDVTLWLARRGMDARYGARPLKRAIDRHLLAPLSEKLNSYLPETPLLVNVEIKDNVLSIKAKSELQAAREPAMQAATTSLVSVQEIRRHLQKLFRSSAALEMDNEIHRLQFIEKRLTKGVHLGPEDTRRLSRLAAWRRLRCNFDELFATTCLLEDEALLSLMTEPPLVADSIDSRIQAAQAAWKQNLLALYLQRFENPDDVILVLFSEHPEVLVSLAETYFRIVNATKGKAEVWQFLPGHGKGENLPLARRLVLDASTLFYEASDIRTRAYDNVARSLGAEAIVAKPWNGVVGLALVNHGLGALPRFAGEAGLHVFRTSQGNSACLVDTSEREWRDYTPPAGMDRRGKIGRQERRRVYELEKGTFEDMRIPGKHYATADSLADALTLLLEACLARNVQAILDQ
jgi:ATP-dependent Clp protease ATP-binding subunit ClpC